MSADQQGNQNELGTFYLRIRIFKNNKLVYQMIQLLLFIVNLNYNLNHVALKLKLSPEYFNIGFLIPLFDVLACLHMLVLTNVLTPVK